MGSDLKKFVNPKFLKTIDPALMRVLFVRHFGEDELPVAFEGEASTIRAALAAHFEGTVAGWNAGMVADLHRVAELGTSEGMQLILNEARRRGVVLYPEPDPDDAESAPIRHDPKHVALHTYLLHHRVFEAAADFHALRAVKYAVLRYSPVEGRLFVGGVVKAQQGEIAELFARHVLRRPGFFSGRDARDLYTLDPISDAGPDFAFQHRYDESIKEVRIVAAAADLFERDEEDQRWRHVRSWESKDASGGALTHFRGSEVRFGRGWRLGEITFRVAFETGAKRPAQVTVRLKPPGTLAFRRTRFEKAIHTLVQRNGLEKDRDAGMVVDAAE